MVPSLIATLLPTTLIPSLSVVSSLGNITFNEADGEKRKHLQAFSAPDDTNLVQSSEDPAKAHEPATKRQRNVEQDP